MADPGSSHGPRFGHGGSGPGFSAWGSHWTQFRGSPLTVVVLCNSDKADSLAVVESLLRVCEAQVP
jgi:D-alanyl-D-alanine carboxypeptidase